MGALLLGCGRGALRLEVVQPPGGKPMPADAYLRGHSLPATVIAPARALAFETIRATFEDGAFTERAFREAAEQRGIAGRERAQAQRLAFGAVQRRGTADAAIERLAGRSTRLLDPPVLAALRLGLYELLFADGHARPRRRRPGGRAGQGRRRRPRRRASSTRSCAAPPASGPS